MQGTSKLDKKSFLAQRRKYSHELSKKSKGHPKINMMHDIFSTSSLPKICEYSKKKRNQKIRKPWKLTNTQKV